MPSGRSLPADAARSGARPLGRLPAEAEFSVSRTRVSRGFDPGYSPALTLAAATKPSDIRRRRAPPGGPCGSPIPPQEGSGGAKKVNSAATPEHSTFGQPAGKFNTDIQSSLPNEAATAPRAAIFSEEQDEMVRQVLFTLEHDARAQFRNISDRAFY